MARGGSFAGTARQRGPQAHLAMLSQLMMLRRRELAGRDSTSVSARGRRDPQPAAAAFTSGFAGAASMTAGDDAVMRCTKTQ